MTIRDCSLWTRHEISYRIKRWGYACYPTPNHVFLCPFLDTRFETEMRVVKLVASDTSLSLSSPFSSDFSTEINFEYYKKPEEVVTPEMKRVDTWLLFHS